MFDLKSNVYNARRASSLAGFFTEDDLGYCQKWHDGTLDGWEKEGGEKAILAATMRQKCDSEMQTVFEIAEYLHQICPPQGTEEHTSANDLMAIIFPFANQNKDAWQQGFPILTMKAFQSRWPCK